jgi:hypothetical protein
MIGGRVRAELPSLDRSSGKSGDSACDHHPVRSSLIPRMRQKRLSVVGNRSALRHRAWFFLNVILNSGNAFKKMSAEHGHEGLQVRSDRVACGFNSPLNRTQWHRSL